MQDLSASSAGLPLSWPGGSQQAGQTLSVTGLRAHVSALSLGEGLTVLFGGRSLCTVPAWRTRVGRVCTNYLDFSLVLYSCLCVIVCFLKRLLRIFSKNKLVMLPGAVPSHWNHGVQLLSGNKCNRCSTDAPEGPTARRPGARGGRRPRRTFPANGWPRA